MKKSILSLLLATPLMGAAIIPGTFDELPLAPNSQWNHYDSPDYTQGEFSTGSFRLTNQYDATWQSWSHFGYANYTSDSSTGWTDDMVSAAGGDYHGGGNYGVVFMDIYNAPTMLYVEGGAQQIPGLMITNTAWVKDCILNGDGMNGPFAPGDKCGVYIYGKRANGTFTAPLQVLLADYTGSELHLIDTWQYVSLASLGEVTALKWEFFSSKTSPWGITTPAYCCIDAIGESDPASTPALSATSDKIVIHSLTGIKLHEGAEIPSTLKGPHIVTRGGTTRVEIL